MASVLEDVHEISNLKARYAAAVDGGWAGERPHDPDAVVPLFVEDGVWDGGAMGRGVGHAGIRAYLEGGEAIAPFVFHHISGPDIQIEGDRATGRWHVIVPITQGDVSRLLVGTYDDRFVRTAEGWRFELLRFTPAAITDLPKHWEFF